MSNIFSYVNFSHPRNKYKLDALYTAQLAFVPGYPILKLYMAISKLGILTLRKGYAWNGASGPVKDTYYNMEPSAVHDALCQALEDGDLPMRLKPQIDEEYRRRLAKEAGPLVIWSGRNMITMHNPTWWDRFKAKVSYYALRAFGGFFTRRKERG